MAGAGSGGFSGGSAVAGDCVTRISACDPSSQKCVSTLNDDGYPAFEPVAFDCSPDEAFVAVRRVVAGYPRTEIVEEDSHYLAAICTTRIMRFKDEVQAEVDADQGVVHLKSYSTLKWAGDDLNANRTRLDELVAALRAELPGH